MSLYPKRGETKGQKGMVVAKHPLAAEAGIEMLNHKTLK